MTKLTELRKLWQALDQAAIPIKGVAAMRWNELDLKAGTSKGVYAPFTTKNYIF